MPKSARHQEPQRSPQPASDQTSGRTADDVPRRRRGGQELPDDVQDRPEQNAGYDAAVRGESTATPQETVDDLEMGLRPEREGMTVDPVDDFDRPARTPDERAERDAAADVRARDRRSR